VRLGGVLVALLVAAALVGPSVLPYSPTEQDRGWIHESPSLGRTGGVHGEHLLGTDGLGRDVLTRAVYGARYSVLTAIAGVVVTGFLGTLLGAVSGFFGGLTDRLLMRGAELFMTLPALYLMIALRNVFPDSISPVQSGVIVVATLAIVGWSAVARLIRAQVLSLREQDFVTAARAAGATRLRLLLSHVLPALRPFVLLQMGLLLPYFLLGEVTLSFLGLGLPEPMPSWGNMMAAAASSAGVLGAYWWEWLAPGALLTLAVLGANLIADGLRRRYVSELPPEAARLRAASWATRASRFWSSSTWGSKHLRHRAS
jgi:peptide/nickel transport system permease protein